ncbi:protein of unknown function [Streptomyces sp. KY75]|nr:protein of unknown function [Streptomyces sp. KY75]
MAIRIALRRSEGARVIQLASGCMPMISEWACWAIWRTSVARYASGIQSRGSMRSSAATAASKTARRAASAASGAVPAARPAAFAVPEVLCVVWSAVTAAIPGSLPTDRSVH